jgi:hypothetical protein
MQMPATLNMLLRIINVNFEVLDAFRTICVLSCVIPSFYLKQLMRLIHLIEADRHHILD